MWEMSISNMALCLIGDKLCKIFEGYLFWLRYFILSKIHIEELCKVMDGVRFIASERSWAFCGESVMFYKT